MRRSMTTLFFLLLGTLLVRHVRAVFLEPAPKSNDHDDSSQTPGDTDSSDDNGNEIANGETNRIVIGGSTPVTPGPSPAGGNEGEENIDYSSILKDVSSLLDAVTSITSDLSDGSSTTASAPLPTAALPCYSVSNQYDGCALNNSEFSTLGFPIQASCLCYVTRPGNDTQATWAPNSYDGLMSRCKNFAQTQNITNIGNNSSDFNLCSSAGDVRATPAPAAASSTTTQSTTPASASTSTSGPQSTFTGSSGDRIPVLKPLVACMGLWLCRMAM